MAPTQLGLVLHPCREIDDALQEIRGWASAHGVAVGQVPIPGQARRVGEPVDAASCDLVLAVGGDGTTLAALHATALEHVAAGNWTPRALPGLEITARTGEVQVAINDFAVIRDGTGQVITAIRVDGELYARTAGDGLVVATPLGSSAYSMAAGGPLLAPGAEGIVVTPLAQHGGVAPPLVAGPHHRVQLLAEPGYGGSRFEIDGQAAGVAAHEVSVTLCRDYASLVALAAQEPMLT